MLATECRISKGTVDDILHGRVLPKPIVALTILRVLKPNSAVILQLLRLDPYRSLFTELELLFRETGMFSLITAQTGLTSRQVLKPLLQARYSDEMSLLKYALKRLHPDNPNGEKDRNGIQASLIEWKGCLPGLDMYSINYSHYEFHSKIHRAARRAGWRPKARLNKYDHALRLMLPEAAGALRHDIVPLRTRFAELRKLMDETYEWITTEETRVHQLHQALATALFSGHAEQAAQLLDLHWCWTAIDPRETEMLVSPPMIKDVTKLGQSIP